MEPTELVALERELEVWNIEPRRLLSRVVVRAGAVDAAVVHLDELCAHLQSQLEQWARRQHDPTFAQSIQNLLATLPPGTLKSRALVIASAWAWLTSSCCRASSLTARSRSPSERTHTGKPDAVQADCRVAFRMPSEENVVAFPSAS